jgi:hypothetical protein
VAGTALLGGLAFGAGVAISSSLWGWSSPNWNHGDVNVNVNRWNNINANRQRAISNTWSPTWNRPGGARPTNLQRPPGGPVGAPIRNAGLPANAIGRPNVNVPRDLVSHPVRPNAPAAFNPQNRPNLNPGSRPQPQAGSRPQFAGGQGPRERPAAPAGRDFQHQPGRIAPGQGGGGQRFQPQRQQFQERRPDAFSGMNDGNRAAAFGQRGTQSRQAASFKPQGGFRGGGGFQPGAGGGGFHGGFHGRR